MATKLFERKHEVVRVTVSFTREHFNCWLGLVSEPGGYPASAEQLLDFFDAIFGGCPPEGGKLPNFVQAIHDSRPEVHPDATDP